MKALLNQQHGVTFGGFIMILVLFIVFAMMSMKIIPSYLENGKIQNALDAIVRDPAMQNATVAEIKDAFSKRANIMDDVTAVNSSDLEIFKEGGQLKISATYSKKVPFAGNVSLLIEFHPSAPK